MTRTPVYIESCTQLVPGAAEAYEEFHRAVPRRIDEQLRRAGVLSWQIYRRGDVLTHCVRKDGREHAAEPDDIATSAWWREQVKPFLMEGASPAVTRPRGRLIWDLDWPTREDIEQGVC
jgi:L-rhamnose mutarotase